MFELNFLAVGLATLAAFVASAIWYMILGKELAKVSPAFAAQRPAPWKMGVVILQSLVLATVLAYIIQRCGANDWLGAVWIGFVIWIGLSAVQWIGSILWENVPFKMAAIHAGDWLMKLLLISVIIGLWQ